MSYLKNSLLVWAVLVLLFVASTGSVFAFSYIAPPAEKTGAPNEGTCADCHAGNALNTSGGSLMLTIPETYEPNEVYEIVVSIERYWAWGGLDAWVAPLNLWGFEMTALDENDARAGSFEASYVGTTQLKEANSKQYITHTRAGTTAYSSNAHSWKVKWTAPDADVGPIIFYAAGNAANGDGGTTGDWIYTTQSELIPPIPVVAGVSLEIVGDTVLSTMDTVAGVNYTLKVTNTGNMMDTITLEASAEVGIEGNVLGALSDNAVELEAGATTEVTLTVAGDLLTEPGDYPISVTATSKTDSTMTAEVTTTTTIEMKPPPPWDVNGDGTVNIQDLVLVAGEFGQSGESLKGDVNGDGSVNILDLALVSSHFGEDV